MTNAKNKSLWWGRRLLWLAAVVLVGFSGCIGQAKRHATPDRTRLQAAAVRVERAIPVVRATHARLGQSLTRTQANHGRVAASHAAEQALLETVAPELEKVRTLAFQTSLSDVDLVDLQGSVTRLDSTVAQLRSTARITATEIAANTTDLTLVQGEQGDLGRAIEELSSARDVLAVEQQTLFAQYDPKLARLNEAEVEIVTLKTENRSLFLKLLGYQISKWVGVVASGLGALLYFTGKLKFA